MRSAWRIALVTIVVCGCATVGDDAPKLEATWREHMLTESYGTWHNGQEVFKSWEQNDTVHSFPEGAGFTRYRIKVSSTNDWGNGEDHHGGLLGRARLDGMRVELFGKLFAPIRLGGFSVERGQGFDVFLVVRPAAGGYGRLVKHWRFAPKELLLTGDPVDPDIFRRSTRNEVERRVAPGSMGTYRFHFVDAYLDVDEPSRTATVTVTGLKRPLAERVDLTPWLTGF
jgi:hypothetical protein